MLEFVTLVKALADENRLRVLAGLAGVYALTKR